MKKSIEISKWWTWFSTIYFIIVAFLILHTPLLPLIMMLGYSIFCYFVYSVRHWRYFPVIFLMINNCMSTTTVLWLDYRKWFTILLVGMFILDMCLLDKMEIGCFFYNKYFIVFYFAALCIDILSKGTYTIFSLFFEFVSLAMVLYEISYKKQLDDFIDMLIISTLCIALIGIYEFAIQDTFYYKRWTGENRYRYGILRVGSTVEDPNFMCFSMVPSLPLMAYKVSQGKNKFYYSILQVIFCGVILLTMSRIGLLTMLLGYFLIYFNKIQKVFQKNKALVLYIMFASGILAVGVLLLISSRLSFNMSDDSFSGRYYVYVSALKIIFQNPIWGLGFEKFADTVEKILLKDYGMYNAIGFQNPMNTWLQVAVDGGLLMLIPFVMVFVTSIKIAINIYRRHTEYQYLIKMLAISLIQWGIISFTLDGMENAIMWSMVLIPVMLKKVTNNSYVEEKEECKLVF